MAYIWQRWIADELRAAIAADPKARALGIRVVEVKGWKNRGRPASTGAFDPDEGHTNHHTAATASASNPHPTLGLLIAGRSDLPGPLAQTSTAFDGVIYVIAAGRANHAGRTDKSLPGVPAGSDGNAHFMGNEIESNGKQRMSEAQRYAVALVNRVYLEHFDRGLDRVHRHQDLTTRKWDLGSLTTAQLRADARAIDLTPEKKPMPAKPTMTRGPVVDDAIKALDAFLAGLAKAKPSKGNAVRVRAAQAAGKTARAALAGIKPWSTAATPGKARRR